MDNTGGEPQNAPKHAVIHAEQTKRSCQKCELPTIPAWFDKGTDVNAEGLCERHRCRLCGNANTTYRIYAVRKAKRDEIWDLCSNCGWRKLRDEHGLQYYGNDYHYSLGERIPMFEYRD